MNNNQWDEGFDWTDDPDELSDSEMGQECSEDSGPEPSADELWASCREPGGRRSADPAPVPYEGPCEALGSPQAGEQGRGGAKPGKTKRPFIRGPMCSEWWVRAAGLRKAAIHVGLALWFRVGVEKDDFFRSRRAESIEVRVDRGLKRRFEITATKLSNGLHALEEAGLIRIVKGGRGRCPVVVIVSTDGRQGSRREVVSRNPRVPKPRCDRRATLQRLRGDKP